MTDQTIDQQPIYQGMMTYDQFFETFRPVPLSPTGVDSDTYIREYDEVKGSPDKRVWTIVEGEDDGWYAMAGWHYVNRIGYLLCEVDWVTGIEDAVWFEADEFDEEESEEESEHLS